MLEKAGCPVILSLPFPRAASPAMVVFMSHHERCIGYGFGIGAMVLVIAVLLGVINGDHGRIGPEPDPYPALGIAAYVFLVAGGGLLAVLVIWVLAGLLRRICRTRSR
jgi:hypothetical protein